MLFFTIEKKTCQSIASGAPISAFMSYKAELIYWMLTHILNIEKKHRNSLSDTTPVILYAKW